MGAYASGKNFTGADAIAAEEKVRVLHQLDRLLASPLFNQSKRYAPFLRHVVMMTVEGDEDALKERTIAVEVFGRPPDYDNANDPVVRVTAGEVRKRIAQYYHQPAHEHELRIDLIPGSYIPEFHFPASHPNHDQHENLRLNHSQSTSEEADPTGQSFGSAPQVVAPAPGVQPIPAMHSVTPSAEVTLPTRMRPAHRLVRASILCLVLLVLIIAGWWFVKPDPFVLSLWGSVLEGNSPVLISAGEPNLYLIQSEALPLKPVTGQEHVRGDVLSYSEVQALVRIVTFLEHRSGSLLDSAALTTFSDLRRGPSVLLGGLNNPWTMRAQQTLRYQMATDGKGVDWIVDRQKPAGRDWIIDVSQPYAILKTDYAIVARFVDPNTQQPTLIVAGLGENGTRAASEFLTAPQTMHQLGQGWLAGAKDKSFEIVLETQLINGAYGPPKIVAREIW